MDPNAKLARNPDGERKATTIGDNLTKHGIKMCCVNKIITQFANFPCK